MSAQVYKILFVSINVSLVLFYSIQTSILKVTFNELNFFSKKNLHIIAFNFSVLTDINSLLGAHRFLINSKCVIFI